MFFFQSVHNKNHAKTPAVDAQAHLLVVFQPLPIRLVLPVAMKVLNNHHGVVFFENQWIIVNEIFQSLIKFFIKVAVIPSAARNLASFFEHLFIKVKHQRRMQMVFALCLPSIFQITDNHRFKL